MFKRNPESFGVTMVLLGTGELGLYPLGGYVVFLGNVSSPYTPDLTFATKEDFKVTWGPMDNNYHIVCDKANYLPSDNPFWVPYNQDATYSFTVVQQTTGASEYGFGFGFDFLF